MKKKFVYTICSTVEDVFLVYGTRRRAELRIRDVSILDVFGKSSLSNLFISKRVVF